MYNCKANTQRWTQEWDHQKSISLFGPVSCWLMGPTEELLKWDTASVLSILHAFRKKSPLERGLPGIVKDQQEPGILVVLSGWSWGSSYRQAPSKAHHMRGQPSTAVASSRPSGRHSWELYRGTTSLLASSSPPAPTPVSCSFLWSALGCQPWFLPAGKLWRQSDVCACFWQPKEIL